MGSKVPYKAIRSKWVRGYKYPGHTGTYKYSAWRPQLLGKVDRSNQTLKWALTKLCHETQGNWIKLLPTALRDKVKSSAFELMYGRHIPHAQEKGHLSPPEMEQLGNSLVVQWLGHSTFTAGAWSSIPGQGTNILQAAQHGQTNKQKEQLKCAFQVKEIEKAPREYDDQVLPAPTDLALHPF